MGIKLQSSGKNIVLPPIPHDTGALRSNSGLQSSARELFLEQILSHPTTPNLSLAPDTIYIIDEYPQLIKKWID